MSVSKASVPQSKAGASAPGCRESQLLFGLWPGLKQAADGRMARARRATFDSRTGPISVSCSESDTTDAYFACRSNRLAECANHERSKQHSSTTKVVKPCEKASTAVARTQPEVDTPHTTAVSAR